MGNKVRIEMTNHGKGRVWIDDVEVEGVTNIEYSAGVNCANTLRLEFLAKEIDVTDMTCDVRKLAAVKVAE